MFDKARMKLALWYLLIIIFISVLFSFIVFRTSGAEIEKFARLRTLQAQQQLLGKGVNIGVQRVVLPQIERNLLLQARQNIRNFLLKLNFVILLVASGLGYLLAGYVLRPIRTAHENQSRFVSDASHELRSPLTAMRTSLEVALRSDKLSSNEATKLLAENLDDVKGLQYLTSSLIQMTQLSERKTPLTKTEIDVEKTFQELAKKFEQRAALKKIKLDFESNKVLFMTHAEQIQLLLGILLDNAIKYSNHDTSIQVKANKLKKNVTFSVQNQGIGISKKDLPYIFDRFYRSDIARSHGGGYGLGLAIASQVASSLGGKVTAESIEGMGAKFIVCIPSI